MTDRRNICKCGNAVGDLLTRTYRLGDLLERIKFEEASKHIPGHKESINYIYGSIINTTKSCNIDTEIEQNYAVEAFDKTENMEIAKDSKVFYINRNEILNDLSRVRDGIMEKVRECSKE